MTDMKNLKFGLPKRKRFTIDGDESRVVELDTGDTGIVSRWGEMESWFLSMQERLSQLEAVEEGNPEELAPALAEIEGQLRENLNRLFDTDVCTPIAGAHGSLIRTVDGEPLFYRILEVLVPLYEQDIKVEADKSRKRIEKHTGKYVK